MGAHELDGQQARRIAIRAQLLDARRPTDLVDTVRHLTLLQLDPTAAVAPNADLVAWTRLGDAYRPEHLRTALDDRRLVEYNALVRPMEDIALYLARASDPDLYPTTRAWVEQNDGFRRDVLARLADSGPLTSREVPDTCQVPWPSSGWTNNRNVTQMLELLTVTGDVAVSGRSGRERVWDLAERVYPADLPAYTSEEAKRIRDERRLRALGIARATGTAVPVEPAVVGEAGEEAVVDGVKGTWRVDADQLARVDEPFEGRTALLSPFDRLAHDRGRALDLFDFEYTLEMYKPRHARRWGYFALPILHGDRLVGKLDAQADRKRGAFAVAAVHEDTTWTRTVRRAVDAEIDRLAGWLGLGREGVRADG